VVDVDTIGLENLFELVYEGLPCCFNTKNIENLGNIVAVSFDRINFLVRKTSSQIAALSFKDNVLTCFFLFLELFFRIYGHYYSL
jgi:hypothetical protein